MVCLKNNKMSYVSLEDVIGKSKFVRQDDELVNLARALGISFGD